MGRWKREDEDMTMLKLVGGTDERKTISPPSEEITQAAIARLAKWPKQSPEGKPDKVRDEYLNDSELPGFRLRRTPLGTITFEFRGRVRGVKDYKKLVMVPLGKAGEITPAKARAKAITIRDELARGINPAEQKKAAAEAAIAAEKRRKQQATIREWTLAFALERMLEAKAAKIRPATVTFYRAGIKDAGKLARVPIVDITGKAVRDALGKLEGTAKPAKTKRALSGVIGYAIDELELNIVNPVKRVARGDFKAPDPRTNYIPEADIGGFIRKLIEHEDTRARDYILLTLLYGTRKNELMQMRWDWIDWESGTITIPATVTKQKRAHRLPLTGWTRAILEARQAANVPGGYVFPGDKRGPKPKAGWGAERSLKGVRTSLTQVAGEGFKLHDLRRTLTTHCASLGIHGSRMKAIVGHAKADVTENYDQREIEQVRRDLTTYHDWLEMQFETWRPAEVAAEMMEAAFGDMEAIEPPPAKRWPGV
jgi:integrase